MKTASSLAVGKEQILGYSYIMWALDFMVVFLWRMSVNGWGIGATSRVTLTRIRSQKILFTRAVSGIRTLILGRAVTPSPPGSELATLESEAFVGPSGRWPVHLLSE